MASATPTSPQAAFTLKTILKHQPFRTLWMAQFVSIFGDFLALFAIISYITFRLHGNAGQVTSVMILYMLPLALITPVAGVFVDHWNVKLVMIASDLLRGGLILALVFAHSVGQISAILFGISVVSSFFMPAQSVTVRTVVPMEGLLAANALMSQAFYVVRLVSPLIAAALVARLTEKSCYYLDAASFVFSAAMIFRLTVQRPARAQTEKTVKSLTQDFVAGNKFIFTHAGLAFVFIAMATAMFVMSCFSPLISIYIRDSLSAGTKLFGVISSMVGIGLIFGTLLVTRLVKTQSKAHVVLAGLLGLGAGAAFLGGFHNIPMATLSTFTIGFAIAFVIVPAQTLYQQETPHAMVGRVSSSFMSLISFAQVAGLLLSGYLAQPQRLGIRPLFMASAGALALLAGLGYLMMRNRPRVQAATAAASAAPGPAQSSAATSE
ncbi:MAG TPA: MFS transporter [Candidatus Angelobacter sp.]|nr:MFS transporter [Candidatus Angelobacter sp.]